MRKNATRWIVLASLIGVVLIGLGFFNVRGSREGGGIVAENASSTLGAEVAVSTLQTRVGPAGQKEYANTTNGFSFFYPEELSVREYSEAGNSHSISFENDDGSKAFQMYITPYTDSQITLARMQADTRNTASGDPQEIVLQNGTHALTFWSDGGPLGKMREVWFIHKGKLYEVSTYADLDAWLSEIMSTWMIL